VYLVSECYRMNSYAGHTILLYHTAIAVCRVGVVIVYMLSEHVHQQELRHWLLTVVHNHWYDTKWLP